MFPIGNDENNLVTLLISGQFGRDNLKDFKFFEVGKFLMHLLIEFYCAFPLNY